MDLVAYVDIDKLKKIAETNGIEVPRLRGYRLMKDEGPIAQDELDRYLTDLIGTYWWLATEDVWVDGLGWYRPSEEEFRDGYRPSSIPKTCWGDWPIFMKVGMLKARFKRQYMLWNRYAGQKNVLYIHSRMGGRGIMNYDWSDDFPEGWNVRDQVWFLDVCADAFDPTYCDIYARIKEE